MPKPPESSPSGELMIIEKSKISFLPPFAEIGGWLKLARGDRKRNQIAKLAGISLTRVTDSEKGEQEREVPDAHCYAIERGASHE